MTINSIFSVVTNERVEFENKICSSSRLSEKKKITHYIRGFHGIYLKLIKEKVKDRNMQLVGLGNTRINDFGHNQVINVPTTSNPP